jgi:hypothetical protein
MVRESETEIERERERERDGNGEGVYIIRANQVESPNAGM